MTTQLVLYLLITGWDNSILIRGYSCFLFAKNCKLYVQYWIGLHLANVLLKPCSIFRRV